MQYFYKVFCLLIFIGGNGMVAHDSQQKDLTIRSIDSNTKSNDQPLRVNLTCKFRAFVYQINKYIKSINVLAIEYVFFFFFIFKCLSV